MANSDFFLNFGSNANVFANKLDADLRPANAAINELIDSLENYEGQLERTRGKSAPLDNLFSRLDEATTQFSNLTGQLSSTFNTALRGITDLRADLSALVTEIRELPSATARGRQSIRNVSQEEAQAAQRVQTRPWTPGDLNKIVEDARSARNALKRVGDINATVARNATEGANALQNLGTQIRSLTQLTRTSTRNLEQGRISQPVIVLAGEGGINLGQAGVVGGGGGGGPLNLQGIQALISQVTGQAAGQVAQQFRTDAEATAAAVRDKGIRDLDAAGLRGAAEPGRYSILGSPETRPVGFDLRRDRPGRGPESFEEYFARNDAVRGQIEQIRSSLPAPSKEDLNLYNLFRQTGGRQADDVFERMVKRPPGTVIPPDQVRASFQGMQLGALTPGQIQRLPEVLNRIAEVQRQQDVHAQAGIRGLLQNDPWATFQGGATGKQNADVEIGNVIGRAIHEIDEQIRAGQLDFGGAEPGRQFREEARASGQALRRVDFRDASGNLSQRTAGQSVVDDRLNAPETLSGRMTRATRLRDEAQRVFDRASEVEREGAALALQTANETLVALREEAATRRTDLKRRAEERRDETAAFLAGPRTAEQIAAQAARSPEAAAITQRLRAGLTDTDVRNVLDLPATTRTAASARTAELAERRERAQTQLEAFQANPEVFAAQRRAALLSEAEGFRRNTDLPYAPELAREREASAGQSMEQVEAGLRQAIADLTTGIAEAARIQEHAAVTEQQRAEAVTRLESQRAQVIERETARLTATTAVQPAEVVTSRRIFRGENPEAASAGTAQRGTLQGRFFTEDINQAREYAGPTGRVVSTNISQAEFDAARERAVKERVLEGLVVPPEIARRAVEQGATAVAPAIGARPDELRAQREQLTAERTRIRSEIDQAGGFGGRKNLDEGGRAAFDELTSALAEVKAQLRPVNQELHRLEQQAAATARDLGTTDNELRTARGGGGRGRGGGRRPPTGGGGDEPPEEPLVPGEPGPRRNRAGSVPGGFDAWIAQFSEETRRAVQHAREIAQITGETQQLSEAQRRAVVEAAGAFRADPAFYRQPNLTTRRGTFAQMLGLPTSSENFGFLKETFGRAGLLDRDPRFAGTSTPAQARASSTAAGADEAYTRVQGLVEGQSSRVAQAMLREVAAQDALNQLRARGTATDAQYARAEAALIAAQRGVQRATELDAQESQAGTLGRKMFGQRGFIDGQLRHLGAAIENIAGYTLVFTGWEKLKEIVDDGIQADAAFVRLQASLDATGRSTGLLRSQLQGVSSATAETLPSIVEAASELTGVFKNNADLVQGTRVAGMLANISQGTLTAKEAAIGLRDVTDAYGLSGPAAIQKVGDEIARLSQTTGVSVKDIVEGTTQLAQESRMFAPGDPARAQRMSAVLSAYVTRSTGETGESAAEQVSRIMSTLNTGRVQNLLTRIRIPGTKEMVATREQFQAGDVGTILQNLLANFDKLTPSSQQAITALVGSGRQARAFAGLLRDAAAAAKELGDTQGDTGALAQQNQRVMASLGGTIKALGNDFRNLGATLQRLGAFDLLGVLAKSLDTLLKVFNSTFGRIADVINRNPLAHSLREMIVLLGEAAIAFRLFGAVAGSAMGRTVLPGGRGARVAGALSNFSILGGLRAVGGGDTFRMREGTPFSQRFASFREGLASPFALSAAAYGARTGDWGTGERELTARERFSRQVSARAQRVLIGEQGGPLTRAAANAGMGGLATVMNTTAVAAGNVATNLGGRLTTALRNLGRSAVVGTAAMIGISLAIEGIIRSIAGSKDIQHAIDIGYADLTGGTAAQHKAENRGETTTLTPLEEAARKANARTGVTDQVVDNVRNLFSGHGTEFSPPENVESTITSTMHLISARLKHARGNRAGLEAAQAANDKSITEEANFIKSMGLNRGQEANALAELQGIQTSFSGAYDRLHKEAAGIKQINQLNQQQISNLLVALDEGSQFTTESLAAFPGTRASILDQSGLPEGSAAYKNLSTALSSKGGYQERIRAQIAATTDIIRQSNVTISEKPEGDPAATQAIKDRDKALSDRQNFLQQLRAARVGNPEAQASLREARGDDTGAVRSLRAANAALAAWNARLQVDDPQYLTNLKQIQDNKIKIAQLQNQTAIGIQQIAAASTLDPVRQAAANLQIALLQQATIAAEPGGGSVADRTQAAVAVAAARLAQAQAIANASYSALELTIAQLTSRGKQGDLEQAANTQLREAQQRLADYVQKEGGRRGDTTYNQLAAAVATARRNAFDVSLQAQLDTLDFQRETYKITSAQEVASLQEILKNKQLTLKEQRDIILKIKGLQDSIRQQLTGGGFNIPSDIKLPTAYEVRRSLGAGFGGHATSVQNINNSRSNVVVNNNVPTAAIATQIANQVVGMINQQTGQSVRANTSTPRLVGT